MATFQGQRLFSNPTVSVAVKISSGGNKTSMEAPVTAIIKVDGSAPTKKQNEGTTVVIPTVGQIYPRLF